MYLIFIYFGEIAIEFWMAAKDAFGTKIHVYKTFLSMWRVYHFTCLAKFGAYFCSARPVYPGFGMLLVLEHAGVTVGISFSEPGSSWSLENSSVEGVKLQWSPLIENSSRSRWTLSVCKFFTSRSYCKIDHMMNSVIDMVLCTINYIYLWCYFSGG